MSFTSALALRTTIGWFQPVQGTVLDATSTRTVESQFCGALFLARSPDYFAREMIQVAQLDDIITVLDNDLLMDGLTGDVGELVKSAMVEKFGHDGGVGMGIDFLMIDP